MTSPRIAVVMSTYNGEAHVAEQLDSILAQDLSASGAAMRVIVRDDGSTDGTMGVLRGYEERGDIELVAGENLGVVGSFLEVMSSVPAEFDLVALSDQDDRWHADKIARAIEVLSPRDQSIPQLYCSEYVFCDGELREQGRSHLNRRGVDFADTLYENMISGNTTVVNRALVERVNAAGRDGVYCHDWWLALVALSLGELTYDDFASLDYRRLDTSVSPTGSGGVALLRYRVSTFLDKGELSCITRQLARLRELYGDEMAPDKRALLDRMLDGGRLRKAFVGVRLRQKWPEELAVRLLFLLGRL
ncbi:MAG: glycosyltransferase [Atopobiaceae bacterium]|jgi:glycosyltransferase involved in cell wall biosynthesis|nr:glycosyltransferase [Atopobiaceae bacterium]MCI2173746.1 glycosyltransferase [Atopobiaceae bacterium]MCI2207612.1 glycosyltransferase [Atopobiaceae bacterium]